MIKSTEDRLKETIDLMKKLKDLGLTKMSCPDLQQFLEACNRYVREGTSEKGRVKLTGTKRILNFTLIASDGVESHAFLEFKEDV